jgi:hypothetical protein
VSIRRPLTAVLLGGALLGGGALAVIGGLTLRGPGLVAVGLAATLAACTAAGIAREAPGHTRGSALEAAVWAACLSGGGVLVVAGLTTVAGGGVAALAVACCLVAIVVHLVRGRSPRPATGAEAGKAALPFGDAHRVPAAPQPAASPAPAGSPRLPSPVTALTTRALGEEWLRTTAALAGPLTPSARERLVMRRQEALDEFERRDPEGFAKWLAAGPTGRSDPAEFVRGGPAHRGPVADTDAA